MDAEFNGRVFRIGDVTVTSVPECFLDIPLAVIPRLSMTELEETRKKLPPQCFFPTSDLRIVVQAFVVESSGARILVDPCIGDCKSRSYPPLNMLDTGFLERLTRAGFLPESIDIVTSTHLHVDHIGWNTRLVGGEWEPTFPNARYVYSKPEWDHHTDARAGMFEEMYNDSIKPVLDAGLVDLTSDSYDLTAELSFVATPGHTAGHVSIEVSSGGAHGFLTGDCFHHQVQMYNPTWSSAYDESQEQAAQTRLDLVTKFVDRDIDVIGTHFAGASAGRLLSTGSGVRFEPS